MAAGRITSRRLVGVVLRSMASVKWADARGLLGGALAIVAIVAVAWNVPTVLGHALRDIIDELFNVVAFAVSITGILAGLLIVIYNLNRRWNDRRLLTKAGSDWFSDPAFGDVFGVLDQFATKRAFLLFVQYVKRSGLYQRCPATLRAMRAYVAVTQYWTAIARAAYQGSANDVEHVVGIAVLESAELQHIRSWVDQQLAGRRQKQRPGTALSQAAIDEIEKMVADVMHGKLAMPPPQFP